MLKKTNLFRSHSRAKKQILVMAQFLMCSKIRTHDLVDYICCYKFSVRSFGLYFCFFTGILETVYTSAKINILRHACETSCKEITQQSYRSSLKYQCLFLPLKLILEMKSTYLNSFGLFNTDKIDQKF